VDNVQIYYICLAIIGFIATLVGLIMAKDFEDLVKKLVTFFVSIALAVPVAGRIFRWW
jgi:hypothetical protein